MEIVAGAAVVILVYSAIFLLIRANVRRLRALDPADVRPAVRRQLMLTTAAIVALSVPAVLLASDDGVTVGAILYCGAAIAFAVAMVIVSSRTR